jgi:hypothetical protein
MAAQQQKKIHQAQRISAAWRIIEPGSTANPDVIMRRYGLSKTQLKNAVQDLLAGNFKRDKNWNPFWEGEDIFHHPLDRLLMTDIENGSNKGSDMNLLMDPDFDALNGVCHYKWGMDEVIALCEGLPVRLLTIVRNSKNEDELYLEALEFMRSPFFALICKSFGMDAEELLEKALKYRSMPDTKKSKVIEVDTVDNSTGDFGLMLSDIGINGDTLLLDTETTFN